MKTGLYLRFVPARGEFMFYFYDGIALWCFGEPEFFELEMPILHRRQLPTTPVWFKSLHKEPSDLFGFELVEEWK